MTHPDEWYPSTEAFEREYEAFLAANPLVTCRDCHREMPEHLVVDGLCSACDAEAELQRAIDAARTDGYADPF